MNNSNSPAATSSKELPRLALAKINGSWKGNGVTAAVTAACEIGMLNAGNFKGYEEARDAVERRLRIPEKATTLSGAWRPRDPVDDDQGGARA